MKYGRLTMRSTRLLFFILLVSPFLTPGPTLSQPVDFARFTKLEVGNRWEYSIENRYPGSWAPGALLVNEITGAYDVDSVRYGVVTSTPFVRGRNREGQEILVPQGQIVCSFHYVEPQGFPRFELESCDDTIGRCTCIDALVSVGPRVVDDYWTTISLDALATIGVWSFRVDAVANYWFSANGTGGSGGGNQRRSATDIGTFSYGESSTCHWADTSCKETGWTATLIFAIVDGRVYGQSQAVDVMDNEIWQAPEPFAIKSGYPNPTSDQYSIILSRTDIDSVEIRVSDVLGRMARPMVRERVSGRITKITIDTSSLTSGVYIVTLTSGSGDQTQRMFVKL